MDRHCTISLSYPVSFEVPWEDKITAVKRICYQKPGFHRCPRLRCSSLAGCAAAANELFFIPSRKCKLTMSERNRNGKVSPASLGPMSICRRLTRAHPPLWGAIRTSCKATQLNRAVDPGVCSAARTSPIGSRSATHGNSRQPASAERQERSQRRVILIHWSHFGNSIANEESDLPMIRRGFLSVQRGIDPATLAVCAPVYPSHVNMKDDLQRVRPIDVFSMTLPTSLTASSSPYSPLTVPTLLTTSLKGITKAIGTTFNRRTMNP